MFSFDKRRGIHSLWSIQTSEHGERRGAGNHRDAPPASPARANALSAFGRVGGRNPFCQKHETGHK